MKSKLISVLMSWLSRMFRSRSQLHTQVSEGFCQSRFFSPIFDRRGACFAVRAMRRPRPSGLRREAHHRRTGNMEPPERAVFAEQDGFHVVFANVRNSAVRIFRTCAGRALVLRLLTIIHTRNSAVAPVVASVVLTSTRTARASLGPNVSVMGASTTMHHESLYTSRWAPSWAPDTRVGARSNSRQPSLFGTSRRVTKHSPLCLEPLGE
jgi:hypothetical protein